MYVMLCMVAAPKRVCQCRKSAKGGEARAGGDLDRDDWASGFAPGYGAIPAIFPAHDLLFHF